MKSRVGAGVAIEIINEFGRDLVQGVKRIGAVVFLDAVVMAVESVIVGKEAGLGGELVEVVVGVITEGIMQAGLEDVADGVVGKDFVGEKGRGCGAAAADGIIGLGKGSEISAKALRQAAAGKVIAVIGVDMILIRYSPEMEGVIRVGNERAVAEG